MTPVPDPIRTLLLRARNREAAASGPSRREAFRVSRYLIGALLAIGYPAHAVADVLGVHVGSVRGRAQTGAIPVRVAAELLDETVDDLGGIVAVRAPEPAYTCAEPVCDALDVVCRALRPDHRVSQRDHPGVRLEIQPTEEAVDAPAPTDSSSSAAVQQTDARR